MQEFARRRQRVIETMRAAGGGVAVVCTGAEVIRNRDSEYPYRSDSYFRYLTPFPEPQAGVVLVADADRSEAILFCRPKNEERETWDGFRYGPAAAAERFGFDRGASIESLDEEMAGLLANRPALWCALATTEALDASVRRWLAAVRAQARAGVTSPTRLFDLNHVLDEMRLVKDAQEIAAMRRAARISSAAHLRAMRAARPGRREYELEAELLYEFRRNGADAPAYGSIVASGRNACVLHYRANDALMNDGELLLIDAGCEIDGYASDITRTFPVGGRFGAAQRALYDIVLEAQRAAIETIRPGARFVDAHDAAVRVLAQGMIDCRLIEGPLDSAIESGAYRRFYMHRTGHWLGLDVHDCGDYREPARGAAGDPLREDSGAAGDATRSRILRPGMVTTVEPGIYVRAADDVPIAFHDIGIRIEDDALVTDEGCEILSIDTPKRAEDIEAAMNG
ncbi:MAG: aminopeptidase P N-terminal domain-containing protein [Burkholderiaceae bacterium]|nr:aminopeptidase P N-terminal domain-containing protein [Burkholderiaceae bacterium]